MLIANPKEGFKVAKFKPFEGKDYVVVELKYNSGVGISPTGFQAPAMAANAAGSLNNVLNQFNVKSVRSHFGLKKAQLAKRGLVAPNAAAPKKVSAEFAQSGVMQVHPKKGDDCDELAKKLDSLPSVWKAYVAPKPVPAAIDVPNMEPAQGYLCSAPTGIHSFYAWQFEGGQGKGVRGLRYRRRLELRSSGPSLHNALRR